jgi:hypothetical protein
MYWRPFKSTMKSTLASAAAALLLTGTGHAQTDPYNALARDIFKELIEINTTDSVGNVTTASEAMPPDKQAIERLSRDAVDHSIMRTTCVATRLDGGHANNALPQRARATVTRTLVWSRSIAATSSSTATSKRSRHIECLVAA